MGTKIDYNYWANRGHELAAADVEAGKPPRDRGDIAAHAADWFDGMGSGEAGDALGALYDGYEHGRNFTPRVTEFENDRDALVSAIHEIRNALVPLTVGRSGSDVPFGVILALRTVDALEVHIEKT